ncbi:MAG TPA: hypothetical protein VFS42_05120 [Burkholderiaceae bacterium]|nr:hypothetical protein [Burkholderiaceae bacterium]
MQKHLKSADHFVQQIDVAIDVLQPTSDVEPLDDAQLDLVGGASGVYSW